MLKNHKEVRHILDLLSTEYPDARCELIHTSPYELLVATMLSAQCTDVRVNKVAGELFKKYNTPEAIVALGGDKLSEIIQSCGMYKTKSKNILETSKIILKEYNGVVPSSIDELVKLPGVGRKTANVVVSNAYGIPAIAVDTHVFRVSNRIGLACADNVEETERQLMEKVPKDEWTLTHHRLIFHGRRTCKARKPLCEECVVSAVCNYWRSNR